MSKTFAMIAAIDIILIWQANSMGTTEKKETNKNLRKLESTLMLKKLLI